MKLVAATYGTEGDTRPIAALCRALMDDGHDVTLLADSGTLSSAGALGVPNQALAGDIKGTLKPESGIATVIGKSSLNAAAKALAQIANDNAVAWTQQTLEAASGCDGLIVSGLASFAGLSVAERLDIPVIGAGMFPLTPTTEFSAPLMPPRLVPRFLNRFSHHLIANILWRALRDATNKARVDVLALKARKTLWTGHPMLYGVSPTLLPKPADWPANAYMCGQWIRPSRTWQAPDSLMEFLAEGEPPVYVGFGSMVGFDTQKLVTTLVAAMRGRRALFYPGWSGASELDLPDNFHVIGDTPHDWLFPRTSMVIHHGGSGTTHSASRAGVPSIVLPFAGDQFFWAQRLRLQGTAPDTPTARHLSAAKLIQALATADTPQMRRRAATLGEKIRAEDGLGAAVEAVRSLLRG